MSDPIIQDRRVSILTGEYVNFSIATLFIVLRIISRRVKNASFWWDDYCAFGCYLCNILCAAILPRWTHSGLGMHIADITWLTPAEVISKSLLYLFIAEFLYAATLTFAKASLLFLYWRLFKVSEMQRPIIGLFICTMAWLVCWSFIVTFHCWPVQAYWKLELRPTAECHIDDKKFILGSVIAHVAINIAIMLLPIYQIHKLQLAALQKAGIIFTFVLGIFVCVIAIVIMAKTTQLSTHSFDITWNITGILLWGSAEVNLATVSACIPTVRPALAYMFPCGRSDQTSMVSWPGKHESRSKTRINLSAMSRSSERGGTGYSTHALANDMENGSVSDFDPHVMSGTNQSTTSIIKASREEMELQDPGGILVRNETIVQITRSPSH